MPECSGFHADLRHLALKSRIVSLLTEAYHLREKSLFTPFQPSDKRIIAVLDYICDNFTKPLSLDDLSRVFAIGKNHLNALFREETGETIGRYIRKQRLNFAHREILLGKGAEEAAYAAGFNDYSVFFKGYKALFGVPPTRKRRRTVYTLPSKGLRLPINPLEWVDTLGNSPINH
jgi:AraC-like DNA-binding protein